LSASPRLAALVGRLARLPATGGLIFCHPGRRSPDTAADPIAAAREREWAYLASEAFAADLQAADVSLALRKG